jgi:outer-membrane receptor for ferric coprogen and ferric-rhodotorulic acid
MDDTSRRSFVETTVVSACCVPLVAVLPRPHRRLAHAIAVGLLLSTSGIASAADGDAAAEARDRQATDLPSIQVESERPRSALSKLGTSPRETPQSIAVIDRERMDAQNLTSLEQVMAQVPGVTVDLSGTAVVPAFYARGFQIEAYLYDGVPLQSGGSSWTQPDTLAFERIEVLKGVSGLTTGAGQPGGAINLVRKRPTADTRLSASMTASSWDRYRVEADASGRLSADGRVRGRGAASYEDTDYAVDVANQQRGALYAVAEADLGATTTVTAGAYYQRRDWTPAMMGVPRYSDGGDLGLSRSTFLSTPWTYWDFRTTQVFAELEHAFSSDWRLQVNVTGEDERSDLKYAYVYGAIDRATGTGARIAGGANRYDNRQAGVDAYLDGFFDAFGRRHELVLGGNYYDRKADSASGSLPGFGGTAVDVFNFDPGAYADPGDPVWTSRSRTTTRQYGLYGALRLSLADPLRLVLGGRMSWWDTDTRNLLTGARSSDYGQDGKFTPYGGVIYDVSAHLSLYASYAQIFRVQSNYLQEDGSSLPAVTGANIEAGIKGEWAGGRLNASAAVFRIREANRARLVSVIASGGCCYVADGEVESKGLELEVSGQLQPSLSIGAGYTYNTTEYLKDATYQGQTFRSFAPTHLLRGWFNWHPQATPWSAGASVSAQNDTWNEGGTPLVRVRQGGYAIWGVNLGYRLSARWSAGFNIDNLFDKTYYSRLGSSNFGPALFGNVYGEPRRYTVSLRAKL